MKTTTVLLFALSAVSLFAGCANPVDPTEEPVVVAPSEGSDDVSPMATNCTTTRDCSDANYCCYTTTCTSTVLTECYPKMKKARTVSTSQIAQ